MNAPSHAGTALPSALRWHECDAIASLVTVQLASSALDNDVVVFRIGSVAHSTGLVRILVWNRRAGPNTLLPCFFFRAHFLAAAFLH